jgi:two-component system chemotaxis response regulator CheY
MRGPNIWPKYRILRQQRKIQEAQMEHDRSSKPLSVLLVDDSIVLRSILQLELMSAGFTVNSTASGLDAMTALGESQRYDLIITEFHMPGLDGAELVERVRHHPQYGSVPILVLTCGADAGEKERAKAAGATGWIVKPFDTKKLTAAIRKLVH